MVLNNVCNILRRLLGREMLKNAQNERENVSLDQRNNFCAVFDSEFWDSISTDELFVPEQYRKQFPKIPKNYSIRQPKTDGRGRSVVIPSLYFPGFDLGV